MGIIHAMLAYVDFKISMFPDIGVRTKPSTLRPFDVEITNHLINL